MSTQQASQLSSQAARPTTAQTTRPVLHERQLELEEDVSSVGNPLNVTAVEAARPYLLMKATLQLDDTTEEWDDRSNRAVNPAAVNALLESFRTRNVKRKDTTTRMLCGIRRTDFDSLFPLQNVQDPIWLGLWRPRDDPTTVYQTLNWGDRPKIQIIAGQHRKHALKLFDNTNFTWLANIYDLDAMPPAVLIELSGNASTIAQAASMGEVFRDMAAIAPHLAAQDTTIVQPHVNHVPTIDEFLGACRHGDKSRLQKTFMNSLTVCTQYKSSIDKLVLVLASPLRKELTMFVSSGAGMELFSIDGMRDMVETQCFSFWTSWFAKHNRFVKKIMGRTSLRHFDVSLLNKLAGLGSRNSTNVAALFWTSTGLESTESPFPGRHRSKDILPIVSDREYRSIYDRLMSDSNMAFELINKNQFAQFKQHNVPALRSVMDQVLRWLVPAGDFVVGASRYAPKRDLCTVLEEDYFAKHNFSDDHHAAENMIKLVADIVFNHVEYFSPKTNKDLDNYPTVTIKGRGDKEHNISVDDYMKRFKSHFFYFHLAKSVARYVHYNLEQDFMLPFNAPEYHCFNNENTTIAIDLMDGRTSFGHHTEVALNPMLAGKEAKLLHQQITADLRKSIVLRVHAHLTQKVKQEGAHREFSEPAQERILHDQIKFARLAQGYKSSSGPRTGHRRRRDDGDDGHGGDDDDEDGPGSDDFGPRSRWAVDRLARVDRESLERYPPPHQERARDSEAVEDDVHVHFNGAAAKYAEMGLWSEEEEAGNEEESVDLDVDYKRVSVEHWFGDVHGEGGYVVDGLKRTPPQKKGWQLSGEHLRVHSKQN